MMKLDIVFLFSCLWMTLVFVESRGESDQDIQPSASTMLLSYQNAMLFAAVVAIGISIIYYRPASNVRSLQIDRPRISIEPIPKAQKNKDLATDPATLCQCKEAASRYALAALRSKGRGDVTTAAEMNTLAGAQYVLVAKMSASDGDHANAAQNYDHAVEHYAAVNDHDSMAKNKLLAEKYYLLSAKERASQRDHLGAEYCYHKVAQYSSDRKDIETAKAMSVFAGDHAALAAKGLSRPKYYANAIRKYENAAQHYEAGQDQKRAERARKLAEGLRGALIPSE